MKYTILINQQAVVNAGLHHDTDLDDWGILEYIHGWQIHPKATTSNGYVWINYAFLLREMPLLKIKSKQGVSKRINKLKKLNLVDTFMDDDGRVFIKTLDLFYQAVHFTDMSMDNYPNPPPSTPVDTPSTPVDTPSTPVDTPVHSGGHTINHKGSNYKNTTAAVETSFLDLGAVMNYLSESGMTNSLMTSIRDRKTMLGWVKLEVLSEDITQALKITYERQNQTKEKNIKIGPAYLNPIIKELIFKRKNLNSGANKNEINSKDYSKGATKFEDIPDFMRKDEYKTT